MVLYSACTDNPQRTTEGLFVLSVGQRNHPTAADDLLQHYGIAAPWYGKVLGTGLAYRANPKYLQKLPVDVTLYK